MGYSGGYSVGYSMGYCWGRMPDFRYKSFISYSHRDETWGKWLQRALESYRVPRRLVGGQGRFGPVPARIAPVFRDREDLSSAADLSSSVKEELAASETLVVICSPAAAASRWVNEEVRFFRELGRGDRILALIVDGDPPSSDPEQACFPAALVEGEGGAAFEPLAADARKWADGKSMARLKLVAGILGIRLDDLRQRDMQRKHRLWMISAGGAAAVAVLTSVLAVVAVTARNQADNRRQHAEELVDYMVVDLKQKLDEVGRLDILQGVGGEVSKYLETLDPMEETEESLAQKAKVLRQLGEVGMSQNKLDDAMTAFTASREVTRELLRRTPRVPERIFEMSQAEFWVGYVHLEKGEFDAARAALEGYLDYSNRLAELDPQNPEWIMEQSYAHSNIAALINRAESDEVERALEEISASAEFNRRALELEPENQSYLSEYGEVLAWQADTQLLLCDLGGALKSRQENLRIAAGALDRSPANASMRSRYAYSLSGLAKVATQVGLAEVALESLRESADILGQLYAADPSNVGYRWYTLAHEREIALLDAGSGRTDAALERLQSLYDPFREIIESEDEGNLGFRRGWVGYLLGFADVAWLAGDSARAGILWEQAAQHITDWVDDRETARTWRREIVLARFLRWHHRLDRGEYPTGEAFVSEARVESERRHISCEDRSVLVLQALLENDRAEARAQTDFLLSKGYFEAGFIRICRHYGLCQGPG